MSVIAINKSVALLIARRTNNRVRSLIK